MPNRIIKESICTSETIAELSDFEFRLWVGLIVCVDDAGRGDARPTIIKGRVFPLRDRVTVKDISVALHGLAAKGCVSLYEVDGKPYFWFPTWKDHQRIRDSKPKYPEPPEDCGLPQFAASCGELRPESESNTNPNPNPNPNPKEPPNPPKGEPDLSTFGPELQDRIREWLRYKKEKRSAYGPTALKRFLAEIKSKAEQYGEPAIIDLITKSMTNNWQGLFFDKLEGRNNRGSAGTAAPERDRPSRHYDIVSAKLD